MKLDLHIGTEKTGTTTFQRWGDANRTALLQQGIVYPRCFGDTNHRKLSIVGMAAQSADPAFLTSGIKTAKDHTAFVQALRAEFRAEASLYGTGVRWLVSSEHLHSRVNTPEMVRNVANFLGEVFDDITVHIHLRPQIDVAVSLASTHSRGNGIVNRGWFNAIGPESTYYNYLDLVQRWRQTFGADRVRIIPFTREPDITTAICARLKIDTAGLSPPQRANEALDWRTIALVNHLAVAARQARQVLHLPNGFLDSVAVRERLQIGEDLARSVQDRFDASNAELCALVPDITEADLRPDWSRYKGRPNLTALPPSSIYGSQMLELIQTYETMIAAERAQRHLAEAERAIARNNPANAEAFIQKAEEEMGEMHDTARGHRQRTAIAARIAAVRAELEKTRNSPPRVRPNPGRKPQRQRKE